MHFKKTAILLWPPWVNLDPVDPRLGWWFVVKLMSRRMPRPIGHEGDWSLRVSALPQCVDWNCLWWMKTYSEKNTNYISCIWLLLHIYYTLYFFILIEIFLSIWLYNYMIYIFLMKYKSLPLENMVCNEQMVNEWLETSLKIQNLHFLEMMY